MWPGLSLVSSALASSAMSSKRSAALGLLLAIIFGANAQQPIPPPVLKPFADNQQWMLVENLVYILGQTRVSITVPKGFVTDFASIPQPFWSFGLSPSGRYSRAAIIHDYLYWTQACTRLEADNILVIAMKESMVPESTRNTIYRGVRLGGATAWNGNATARARGLPRVIPPDSMSFGPLELWPDYQTRLREAGATDPVATQVPRSCALGATAEVPLADDPASGAER